MESANDYSNLTEYYMILRDSFLIHLGFLHMKKMYLFLNEQLNDISIVDSLILETNKNIIDITDKINVSLKKYQETVERNNLLMKQVDIDHQISPINLIKKVDDYTVISLKQHTPQTEAVDIDIIQKIDVKTIAIKEILINIDSLFMKINALTIRQNYLKKRTLFLSSFNITDKSLIDKYLVEINENEINISTLMTNIITHKNTLPEEIKEPAYKSSYKKSIEFVEKYMF